MRYLGVIGGLIIVSSLAINVMGQVIEVGPYIERGAYYLEHDQFPSAIDQLQKAVELEPENAKALLYLATALRMAGRITEAGQIISKALSLQPEDPPTLLEAAFIEIERNHYNAAEKLLEEVLSVATEPEILSTARQYLERLRQQKPKNYSLKISGGGFYDSNVILEPEGLTASKDKEDWAITGDLSAWYAFFPQGPVTIFGGYNFFQSIYLNEKDYNLQEHTISLALQRPYKKVTITLLYDFKYQSLGGEKYAMNHMAGLDGKVAEGQHLQTGIRYNHEFRDMFDTTVSPYNSDRSGGVDTIKVSQAYFWTPERFVNFGLVYEIEDSDKPWWDRKSLGFVAEGSYDITNRLTILTEISYYTRDADATNPYLGIKRQDRTQQYLLSINWKVLKKTTLMLYGIYLKNDSNSSFLDYSRATGGLKVTVEVL